jgi:hypothetical protein
MIRLEPAPRIPRILVGANWVMGWGIGCAVDVVRAAMRQGGRFRAERGNEWFLGREGFRGSRSSQGVRRGASRGITFLKGVPMRVTLGRCKRFGRPCGLLGALALVFLASHSSFAQTDQPKGLRPEVDRVLRWLPEDTETLFVARSVTLPDELEASGWPEGGVGLACEGLSLGRGTQFKEYDLRLISSVKDGRDIPTGGKALVVVADVDHVLHFRIFDRDGKLVADTDEKKLPTHAQGFEQFRKWLADLWPPHRLKSRARESFIVYVASFVDHAQLNPLRGPKIKCIVRGARNFEGVSSFGSLRSEGCAIIVFENDLGDAAREWTESLRKGAKAVRTVAGREVFVFPSTTAMEPWEKETEWQGNYLVLLEPNIVLCASSDRYLESVLRRVDQAPRVRALPDSLPEWKHVDFDAPVWMLRHVPKADDRKSTIGLTAAFSKTGFRVVYIPKRGSDLNVERIENEWLPRNLFGTEKLRGQLKIVRQNDGAVVLSCGQKPGEDTLWFGWQLYRLQAFELFLGDE